MYWAMKALETLKDMGEPPFNGSRFAEAGCP